jgi:hypothetical protein
MHYKITIENYQTILRDTAQTQSAGYGPTVNESCNLER